MTKRKYARFGESVQRFECTKQKCKWQGKDNDKSSRRVSNIETELVCPECGNNEFYGLLLLP